MLPSLWRLLRRPTLLRHLSLSGIWSAEYAIHLKGGRVYGEGGPWEAVLPHEHMDTGRDSWSRRSRGAIHKVMWVRGNQVERAS